MIDDTQIEEATERQLNNLGSYGLNEDELDKIGSMVLYREEDVKESFKVAINWFLNNLWHPASEKPNIKQGECCITCLVKFKNGSTELCVYFRNPEGWVCDDMSPKDFKRNFKGWLYIDDLFPKKGGK